MSLPKCNDCGLVVLELEGEFAKLDSMLLGDGGPPAASAGWWHGRCLVESPVADAWRSVRLRNLQQVRQYAVVAQTPGWVVLLHPRSGELVGLGVGGLTLALSRLRAGRHRHVDGGAVYRVVVDEYNLELDDAGVIEDVKAALVETGTCSLASVAAVLGISDRMSHPELLAEGALILDEHLRPYWTASGLSARVEYGVFVPDALQPYVKARPAE